MSTRQTKRVSEKIVMRHVTVPIALVLLSSFMLLGQHAPHTAYTVSASDAISDDPLQYGLVAYYPFNGNAQDLSGNGFNGNTINTTLVQDRFGNPSSAYDFNGLSSYIDLGDILDTVFCAPVARFSASGWVMARASGTSYGGGGFIIGKNGGGDLGPYQWSLSYVDGKIRAEAFFDTLAMNYLRLACPMPLNTWSHVTLVFDGSLPDSDRLSLYVNGSSLSNAPLQVVGEIGATTVNSVEHLTIGADHSTGPFPMVGNWFNGELDDFRIYNRALSASEVQALAREGGYDPSLAAYYPFNGNAHDESGNGNDGTVNGATLTSDRFGRTNSAYYFANGASIRIPELMSDSVPAFTITAWVMKDYDDDGNHQVFIKGSTKGEASLTNVGSTVGFGVNLTPPPGSAGSPAWYSANTPDTLRANVYYLLVGRYVKGQRVDMFVNGILGASIKPPNWKMVVDSRTYSALGIHTQAGFENLYCWHGVIDDVRIYSRALADSEIVALFNESTLVVHISASSHVVHLSWDSVPGYTFLRYRIYRGLNTSAIALYDSVSGSMFTYSDSGLTNGATYHYKVAAVDSSLKESFVSRDVSATARGQANVRTVLSGSGYPITGLSLLGDSALYAIASGDAVYRMTLAGAVNYTLQVGGSVNSASSISSDSVVYIASSDKNVYAFSNSGVPVWSAIPLGGIMSTTPSVDEQAGMIYLGVENKNFVAVNRSTGKVAWNFFADAPIRSSAVISSDRMLVFSTVVGTIYALDLADFSGGLPRQYTISAGDSIIGSPAIDPQGAIYFPGLHGKSLKVRVQHGNGISVTWQQAAGPRVLASSVIDGAGTLYLASLDSSIYAVDTADGTLKWTHKTGGSIRSTPAISTSGTIFAGDDAGEVIALDGAGEEQWYYKDSSSVAAPLLYDGKSLFVGTTSGKILALTAATGKLGKVPSGSTLGWLTFQGSNRRTGNQRDAVVLSVGVAQPRIPVEFQLGQNYPNPFNPSTTIRFQLPHRSRIRLIIFNILGQEVARLVDQEMNGGYFERTWNANVASGMYFYRMEAISITDASQRFVDVKKMILLK